MTYYLFRHHWASFIESYARSTAEQGERLGLPEVKQISEEPEAGVVVQVAAGYELLAENLYGGIRLLEDPGGPSLSARDLLQLLPWQPTSSSFDLATPFGLPKRLLARLQSQERDGFQQDLQQLYEALYRVNAPGARDFTVRGAFLQNSPDGYAQDALFFLSRMYTTAIYLWLKDYLARASRARRVKLYRPYEQNPSDEQLAHPYGAWFPLHLGQEGHNQKTKPYLAVLAENLGQEDILLVEPAPNDGTLLYPVESDLLPLYFFGNFSLAVAPTQVQGLPGVTEPRRPFVIKLDVRQDAERNVRRDRSRAGLEKTLRQIAWRQTELKQEKRRVDYLLRQIESEEVHEVRAGTAMQVDPFGRRTSKKLHLFFEQHRRTDAEPPAGPVLSNHWFVLQELVLNSTLAELKELRYVYCEFEFTDSKHNASYQVAFHLVGSGIGPGVESTSDPSDVPPGLGDADLIFEQDYDWRELGYNLYLPAGKGLYPPLRPSYPGPRIGSYVVSKGGDSGPSGWPGPEDERRLFDDLLACAVYTPEGTLASPEEKQRTESFWDGVSTHENDNLCLLYEDPICHVVIPLFLRRTDFVPLHEAAAIHLNQAGLLAGPTAKRGDQDPVRNLVQRMDDQIAGNFAEQVRTAGFAGQIERVSEDLQRQMTELLEQSLAKRTRQLEEERQRREGNLRAKTDDLVRELDDLQSKWRLVRQELQMGRRELRDRINSAQRLVLQLGRRAREVEDIPAKGAQNWIDFVNQVADVAQQLRVEAEERTQSAATHIQEADERLQSSQNDVIANFKMQLGELESRLREIGAHFEGQTVDLQRSLQHLAETRAVIDHSALAPAASAPSAPAAGAASPTPDYSAELAAAQREISTLQQSMQEQATLAQQQMQESEVEVASLRRQSTSLELENERLKKAGEKRRQRERAVRDALGQKERDIRERDEMIVEARRQVDQAEQQRELLGEEHKQEIRELEQRLESISQELDASERTLQEVELEGQSLNSRVARDRFLALAAIVDDLYAAESADPNMAGYNEGLVRIRARFHSFLEREYRVSRLPIEPGRTLFDASQGHHAVAAVWHPELGEQVIVRVASDGYMYENTLIREARVIVNVRPGSEP